MLEIELKHDIHRNYMVIHGEEERDYMLQMLEGTSIGGFLHLEVRIFDNEPLYYYDVTGMESIEEIGKRKKWTAGDLRVVLSDVLETIGKAKEYLLDENHFLLDARYMYRSVEKKRVSLCYTWEYEKNLNEQLTELFAYFMNQIDYEDKGAVSLIYGLYNRSREESCTLQDLWNVFSTLCMAKEMESERETGTEERKTKTEKALRFPKKEVTQECVDTKACRRLQHRNKIYICFMQIAFLALLYGLYRQGIFMERGMLSYTKLGGALLIAAVLDGYILSVFLQKTDESLENEKKGEKKEATEPDGEKSTIQETSQREPLRQDRAICWDKTAEEPMEEDRQAETQIDYDKTVIQSNCGVERACYLIPDEERQPVIEVLEFPFFIGRFQKNTDQLKEKIGISRMHCKIEEQNGHYYVSDLNSTNGTFLNQKKIQSDGKREVKEGDEIAIADMVYRFSMQIDSKRMEKAGC